MLVVNALTKLESGITGSRLQQGRDSRMLKERKGLPFLFHTNPQGLTSCVTIIYIFCLHIIAALLMLYLQSSLRRSISFSWLQQVSTSTHQNQPKKLPCLHKCIAFQTLLIFTKFSASRLELQRCLLEDDFYIGGLL